MNNFADTQMAEKENIRELLSELAFRALYAFVPQIKEKDFKDITTLNLAKAEYFSLIAFLYAREGVLGDSGYVRDPANKYCEYLDKLNVEFHDFWDLVLKQNGDEVIESLRKLRERNDLQESSDEAWDFFMNIWDKTRDNGTFVQPHEVTYLMLGLLDYKGGRVYNPFAGLASFGRELEIGDNYTGEEIFQPAYEMGLVNLLIHNCSPKNYSLADSLRNTAEGLFDYYIASLPLGLKVDSSNLEAFAFLRNHPSKIDINDFALLSSFKKLKENGKSVILCSSSILSSSKSLVTRRFLVEQNLLDMVVCLPAGIFKTTGISTVLVVLRKGRKENEKILFVDATEKYVYDNKLLTATLLRNILDQHDVEKATPERVLEDDCSWNPMHYKDLKVDDPRYRVVRLEEVLQQAPVCFVPTPKSEYQEVLTANLVSDPYRYTCSPTLVDPNNTGNTGKRSSRGGGRKVVFNTPTLVVASLGKLKYGYFRAKESAPIYVSDGYFTFTVNTNVIRPDYLAIMLSEHAQSYYKGSTIPHLKLNDFLRIQIPIPSLDLQREVVERMYADHNIVLGRELELEQEIEEIEAAFSQRNGMNQHNLATPAAQVKATCVALKQQLKDCNLAPETRQMVDTLVERQLLQIHNLLASVYTLDQGLGFGNPEEFNFDEYLSKYNKTSISDRFKVTYFLDQMGLDDAGIEPIVLANEPSFVQMVSNIIRNAEKHGFTDPNRADYYIDIDVRLDSTGKFFVFTFSNNGIPISIDTAHYKMKGETAGRNKGEGFGGYYVYEMAHNFGGDVEVSSRQNPDLTTIKIKLPVIEEEL